MTPMSDAVIPRYRIDQPIERFERMKAMPSRSCPSVEPTACSASDTPSPCASAFGGDFGSVKQKTAASRYRNATTRITAPGEARFTTSGPSSAKPIANAAFRVSVKIPFAASSWWRSTTSGIIAASAGAKNTVTVDTKTFSSRIRARFAPTRYRAM